MQERITIENFGGIKKAHIDLNKINIFIGPQASGKSVIAKLIYFFNELPDELKIAYFNGGQSDSLRQKLQESFLDYFPESSFPKTDFSIDYYYLSQLSALQKDGILRLKIPNAIIDYLDSTPSGSLEHDKFTQDMTKIESFTESVLGSKTKDLIFIPAGRVLFASLQSNIYSFLNSKIKIDPFLIKFGLFYQNLRMDDDLGWRQKKTTSFNNYQDILSSNVIRENDKDLLLHEDGRKTNIAFSSSGQQEGLPLVLTLNSLQIQSARDAVVFIEEPEAHLFPSAQKKIVELIASTFNSNPGRDIRFVITTHSPYILTSFNNLIQAGQIAKTLPKESRDKLNNIVSQHQQLQIEDIAAYSVEDGGATSIIDTENSLINAAVIDRVSNEIAIQFDQLLDLE